MAIEVNFHLGDHTVTANNADVLDPRIVAVVKALARRSAEEDFAEQMKK